MVQLVQQQCDASSSVACVAMVAEVRFDSIRWLRDSPDMDTRELDRLLSEVGFSTVRQVYPVVAPGKVYIAGVPSLNEPSDLHYIVLDTREAEARVYDPQKGRKDRQAYTSSGPVNIATLVEVRTDVAY